MKSNILFLSIDSLYVDRIYGKNKSAKIPNIEKLINSGIFFEQAISTSDSTGISLGSLFTGCYPFKTNISLTFFNDDVITHSDILKKNGYFLCSTSPDLSFFKKLTNKFDLKDFYVYDKRDDWVQLAGGIGKKILQTLELLKNQEPWFYFIHLMDLHQPFYLPEEFDQSKYGITRYDRMISYIDTWFGKIFENTDLKNTLVVISSDHGDYIPLVNEDNFSYKPNKVFKKLKKAIPIKISDKILSALQEEKKKKFMGSIKNDEKKLRSVLSRATDSLYDETLQIPLLFSGCDLKHHKPILDMVRHVDIFPTVIDMVGIEYSIDILDGRSLIPLINNNSLIEEPAYIETGSRTAKDMGRIIGIRTTNYKYLRSRNDLTKNVTLYDLKNDPGETKNIAHSNKQIVNDMECTLQKIRGDYTMDSPIEMTKEENEKIEKELKKLGYIE